MTKKVESFSHSQDVADFPIGGYQAFFDFADSFSADGLLSSITERLLPERVNKIWLLLHDIDKIFHEEVIVVWSPCPHEEGACHSLY